MKRVAALLGGLSAVSSALVVRPVNSYRGFMVKSTATAQTPALALLGAVAAALGARYRSRFATVTGLFAATVGTYYVTRVTAAHGGFDRAFGARWEHVIPPDAERRMLPRRRSLRLPRVPEPGWDRDVPFGTIPGTDLRRAPVVSSGPLPRDVEALLHPEGLASRAFLGG
jgi:hypothetical protein